MQKNMFFFACPLCHAKLVNEIAEVGETRSCTNCNGQIEIPNPPERIPPFAQVTKVEQAIVAICPYCKNIERLTSKSFGTCISCSQCHIQIEIPRVQAAKLQLRLSQNAVVADGKSTVSITVRTVDRNNNPVPAQKVQIFIERQRGQNQKIATTTKDNGQVTIAYTANVYSGVTRIKAVLNEQANTKCELILKELNGIKDERIKIAKVDFSPRDENEDLQGKITLENRNEIDIDLLSVVLELSNDLQWKSDISKVKILAGDKYIVPFRIDCSQPEIPSIKAKVKTLVQLPNARKTFVKDIDCVVPTKGKINFAIQCAPTQMAGEKFALEIRAMRNEKLVTSFHKTLDVMFSFAAQQAKNGEQPQAPQQYQLSFHEGIATSEEVFCAFASQKEAKITLEYDQQEVTKNIEITPAQKPQFIFHLTSPQINGEFLKGKNTITVCDIYGNIIHDFNKPLTLTLENGNLNNNKDTKLQLQPENGTIDLTAAEVFCVVDDVSQPAAILCQCDGITIRDSWQLESLQCDVQLENIKLKNKRILEGNSGKITLEASISPAKFSIEKIHIIYEKTAEENVKVQGDFAYFNGKLEVSFPTKPRTISGDVSMQLVMDLINKTTGEIKVVSSQKIPGLFIEKKGRTFTTICNEDTCAGKPFGISIEAKYGNFIDKSYQGEKNLFLYYGARKETTDLPQKIALEFVDGKAYTGKIFEFQHRQQITIGVEDSEIGGAKGTFSCLIASGVLDHFAIHVEPQLSGKPFTGDNYIVAKDKFDNIIDSFGDHVGISTENAYFYNENFSSVIPGDYFANGKYRFSNFCMTKINIDEPSYISLRCNTVVTKFPVELQPQHGVLVCKNIAAQESLVECGDTIHFNLHLYNNGETSIQAKRILLAIGDNTLCIDEETEINAKEHFRKNYTFELRKDIISANINVYPSVETIDPVTNEEQSYSFGHRFCLQVEPKDRTLQFSMPDQVTAGKKFALQVQVCREGETDVTYNRKSTLQLQGHPTTAKTMIPDCLELNFYQGVAKTPEVFCLYKSQERYAIDVVLPGPGGAESMLTLPQCKANQTKTFHVTCVQKQVACRPFDGNFIVEAHDEYGNINEDFADKVTLETIGSGSLYFNNEPCVIHPQQFNAGKARIVTQNLRYDSTLQETENVQILLRSSQCTSRFPIEITPAPAILQVVNVAISNKKVQWNESNYVVSIHVENNGQTPATIRDTQIQFYINDRKVDEGYTITTKKKPQIMPGERGMLPVLVALNDQVPLGKHDISVRVEYHDEYYGVSDACTHRDDAWQVEPCGREIIFSTEEKPRMLEQFAANFTVMLNGEVDKTYNGKRVYLCSCKDKVDKKIPRKLKLTFYEGMAQSDAIFCFREKAQNVQLEFLEMEVGGASGKVQLSIYPERWPVVIKRFMTSVQRFCIEHRRRIVSVLVALLIILLGFWHWQRVKITQSLRIVSISGTVTVDGKEVRENDLVRQYQNIQLAPGAFCVLQTHNKATVKLYNSANVYINSVGRSLISSTYDNELNVKKGDVSYQKTTTVQQESFPRIAIPDADRMDVSSNKFRVGVKENEGSLVSVYQGSIGLTSGGETVSVGENQGSSVKKGQAPSTPRSLPKAPQWILPNKDNEVISTNAIPLEWRGYQGIDLYNLEVFTQKNPQIPLQSEDVGAETEKVEHKLRGVDNGVYYCQVTSIDHLGFASEPAMSKFFSHEVLAEKCEIVIQGFDVKSGRFININNFSIGEQQYTNNSEITMGIHKITIRQPGYHPFEIEANLNKGEDFKKLDARLIPKPRSLKWIMSPDVGERSQCKITSITQNKKPLQQLPESLLPEQYRFDIEIEGFEKFTKKIIITPGEDAQKIIMPIIAKKRTIKYEINTGLKQYKFNGIVIFNEQQNPQSILPGKYTLQIEQPGFVVVNKTIDVLPKNTSFTLREKITVKKRDVIFYVKKDSGNVPQAQIIVEQEENKRSLPAGTSHKLHPGEWKIRVVAPGCKEITQKVNIPPGEQSFEYKVTVVAQNVPLELNIENAVPVNNAKLTVIDANNRQIVFPYTRVSMLPPGEYTLKISAPGYQQFAQKVVLRTGERSVYNVNLQPVLVRVLPVIIDPQKQLQEPIKAIVHNGTYSEELLLPPGNYTIMVISERYGELPTEVNINVGQDIYQIYADLPYNERDFSFSVYDVLHLGNMTISSPKELRIDNQIYRLQVKEDGRDVDTNKIDINSLGSYVVVNAFAQTQKLTFHIGYYNLNVSLENYEEAMPLIFVSIDVNKFLQHLEKENDMAAKIARLQTTFQVSEIVNNLGKEQRQFLREFIIQLQEESQQDLRHFLRVLGE
ncbi:Ig-like domain-containing protein [Candidatus Uabimicrobium amorphum]|uniref:S-layer-like protein n=1 Tax=Uabimicrobium amorphum TaxID=2596890 RepID=A0A5S9F7A2_UABAM|nr:invasin domain 3-containing protein [Candidatus Uabimicrobium amorphum]BBM87963.1 S-layer-like protein [Candidatus Uabimicrobium amorphum]